MTDRDVRPVERPQPSREPHPRGWRLARQIVAELGRYRRAGSGKRAIAVAVRNRWRRSQAPEAARRDHPSNLIRSDRPGRGRPNRPPAGAAVGPVCQSRGLALYRVGYVGRDVESMIRDLVDTAIGLVPDRTGRRGLQPAEQRRRAAARSLAARPPRQTFTRVFVASLAGRGGRHPGGPPERSLEKLRRCSGRDPEDREWRWNHPGLSGARDAPAAARMEGADINFFEMMRR